ncbi:MAG: hypothetical protein HY243_13070 [Proteobacteria bacterium]|nr:hypothetical protein [Pseudomonadota bacterium]
MTSTLPFGVSIAMIACLAAGFIAMARVRLSPALIMPILASAFLILNPSIARDVVRESFGEFGQVAIVFTAVAIAAHMLQEARIFDIAAAYVGQFVGRRLLRAPTAGLAFIVFLILLTTTVLAAIAHNITAIFVITPLSISLCARYRIPSRWLLCAVLVASNLGGFSTGWGDTPNLIEAQAWNLSNLAFFEILPANLVIVIGLSLAIAFLTGRDFKKSANGFGPAEVALEMANFRAMKHEFRPDSRRAIVGGVALCGFIFLQFFWKQYEIAWGALAVIVAIALERPSNRATTLRALGLDAYLTMASLFVIAHSISSSMLGSALQNFITAHHDSMTAVAIASYLGTLLTGAASWASVAAPLVHSVNGSHSAAWALGGGICAGSSAVLTAASAGIVLWAESGRRRGFEVTFSSYFAFGIVTSVAMLLFYIAYTTFLSF